MKYYIAGHQSDGTCSWQHYHGTNKRKAYNDARSLLNDPDDGLVFVLEYDDKDHYQSTTQIIDIKWKTIVNTLERNQNENSKFWTDGDVILSKNERAINNVADFLEEIGMGDIVTGYYNPKEDEKDDCVDDYTGMYYLSV